MIRTFANLESNYKRGVSERARAGAGCKCLSSCIWSDQGREIAYPFRI